MEWLNLLAVQGTLKSLLQHHSSKASFLQCSALFMVQLSYPYMTPGKTITLTIWTFVSKVMSLLFNMLSWFVIAFLPRSKHLLISLLQSPSTVIFEPKKMICHCFHYFPIYLPWSDGTRCHDLFEFWALLCWHVRWVQLCSTWNILWHCLSLGLEWKLTFSSPVVTAEFSKLISNFK